MSLIDPYFGFVDGYVAGSLWGTSIIVRDTTSAPTDTPVKPQDAIDRPNVFGLGTMAETGMMPWMRRRSGRFAAFDPVPPLTVPIIWRMRDDPTIRFVSSTLVFGPILSGSRTMEVADDKGNPDRAELMREAAEKVLLPLLSKAMPGAVESLHFGNWLHEIEWARQFDRTDPVDARSFLPLEYVLHDDSRRKFTGYQVGSEFRDARYGFLCVNEPHIDPIRGFSRNRAALADWWGKWQSNDNADRIERKASGVSMLVGVPQGQTFNYTDPRTGAITPMMSDQMIRDVQDGLSGLEIVTVPLTLFEKKSIEAKPELANIKAITVEKFDWGSNAEALKGHLARVDMRDRNMIRAWCRPEREGTEGHFGTKAESQTQGALGVNDNELIHSSICAQWDEQILRRWELTNWGPDAVGTLKTSPVPLSDPVQEFLQRLYLAAIADTSTGPDTLLDVDLRALADHIEIPLRPEEEVQKDRDAAEQQKQAAQKQSSMFGNQPINGENGKANGNGKLDKRTRQAMTRMLVGDEDE